MTSRTRFVTFANFLAALALSLPSLVRADPPSVANWSELIDVQTAGHGEPQLIFIAGLGCPTSAWDHVIARFEAGYRCHLVQMAGFAGKPPVHTARYMDDMADAIIGYIRSQNLDHPVIIGHSFGGVIAMKIAIRAPDLPGRLVIVDTMPFIAAVMGPAVEDLSEAKPLAENYRRRIIAESHDEFVAERRKFYTAMTNMPDRAADIAEGASRSDQATVAEAAGELFSTDLRAKLSKIKCPTLVCGALGDNKRERGMSRESTETMFFQQYAALPGVRFHFFEFARHLIWIDDIEGFTNVLRDELAPKAAQR